MKIPHKVPNLEPKSAELTPEYQREVDASVARGEAAYRRAERRLQAAEKRLAQARSRREVRELEELVELRRAELHALHNAMRSTPRPSTNRGRRGHRHVNMGEVL